MGKYILIIMAIMACIYGIFVLRVGSGTLFWLTWEMIGVFFLIWALLLCKDFFAAHGKLKIAFYMIVSVAFAVLVTFCGMIGEEFRSSGENNLDYIIVLGAQVKESGPSVVLKYRLDRAIEYLNDNPDTMCIVSGGQGSNEPFSEAEGMYEYLVEHGIEAERILLEKQSANTVENIRYSKELLEESYNGVGIVTNNFHVFRAVQIAKVQGLENVSGISADSNAFYLPNNILRECCGILKDWLYHNI